LAVGDRHVARPVGLGALLGPLLGRAQRAQAGLLELRDPAFLDGPQRDGVEIVQLLPAPADGGDEVRGLQHAQMLGRRLPRHRERLTQLPEGLAIALAEPVQQGPARRIGQGLEHRIIVAHVSIMQAFTCISQNGGPIVALGKRAAEERKPSSGAVRLVTDSASQQACRTQAAPQRQGENTPMPATLQDILLAPDTKPKVIEDCYALIQQEVSDKSGVSGTAVKLAYKTVNTFM